MVDKPSDVKTAVPVTPAAPAGTQAVPQAPATQVQPTPQVKSGDTTAQVEKHESVVPLQALQEERTRRQALESELNLLRNQVQQPQQQQYQQTQQQPPNQELEKLWETDPRRAVQAEMMMAIEWYDRLNNSLDSQADVLATRYPDFNKWRTSALRYARSLPPHQRQQQGILDMAYFVVRGQNVDDILQQQNDEMMRKFQTGELAAQVSSPAGTVSSQTQRSNIQLSDEQRAVAAAMGLTEEGYASAIRTKPGGTY